MTPAGNDCLAQLATRLAAAPGAGFFGFAAPPGIGRHHRQVKQIFSDLSACPAGRITRAA